MTSPTYKDYVDDASGAATLRDMVHHKRAGTEELLVPPRVNPQVVRRFLDGDKLDHDDWEQMLRAADVARFYGVQPAVKRFAEDLKKDERTVESLVWSIHILRLMGDLGDAAQQKTAAEYFDYLLGHRLFEQAVPEMIECFFHLDAVPDEKKLAAQIAQKLKVAQAAQKDPDGPPKNVIMLTEHLETDLPITVRARAAKRKLLPEKDDHKRAVGLARVYVGLDYPGGIEWSKWAAFEIMAEVRRTNDANAVAGLQAALEAVVDDSTQKQEFRDQACGRALKAIEFLGGQVKQEHKQLLADDKTRRFQLQG